MNSSIKRLLGALLLIGTLGVSSIMAVRAEASTFDVSVSTIVSSHTGARLHG